MTDSITYVNSVKRFERSNALYKKNYLYLLPLLCGQSLEHWNTWTMQAWYYVDDIGLLSSRLNDLDENVDTLATIAPTIELKIRIKKNKLMRSNCKTDSPITVSGDALEKVQDFAYRKADYNRCSLYKG